MITLFFIFTLWYYYRKPLIITLILFRYSVGDIWCVKSTVTRAYTFPVYSIQLLHVILIYFCIHTIFNILLLMIDASFWRSREQLFLEEHRKISLIPGKDCMFVLDNSSQNKVYTNFTLSIFSFRESTLALHCTWSVVIFTECCWFSEKRNIVFIVRLMNLLYFVFLDFSWHFFLQFVNNSRFRYSSTWQWKCFKNLWKINF